MKLTKLEKLFVNIKKEAEKNIGVAEQLFNQINLSNVKKVLEVGCGTGVLSSYLANKYEWNVTGIDLDPEQIKRAKKDSNENGKLRFLEADVRKLPFEENKFDMVLSFDVLHHIPCWDRALEEISRVSKPMSFYVLNDLACSKLIRMLNNLIGNKAGIYSINDIIECLRRSKFELIYKEESKSIEILMKRCTIIFRKNY